MSAAGLGTQRLGVAWEDGALVVVAPVGDGGEPPARWTVVRPEPGEAVAAAAIEAAIAAAGIRPGPAILALGGDAIVVKPLSLPPAPLAALAAALAEDGDRYFLSPAPPRCYGIMGAPRPEGRWAVAAAAEEVESLVAILAAAGVRVMAVTASCAVYRAAARFLARDGVAIAGLVRAWEGVAEWVGYDEDGRLSDYRRWDADVGESPAPWREAWVPGETPVAVVTDEPEAVSDDRAAEAHGPAEDDARAITLPARGLQRPARLLGALGAALVDPRDEDLPDLVPAVTRERWRRVSARRTKLLATAVVALAVLFVALWGARQHAQGERLAAGMEAVRAEADETLTMRAEVERISRQLVAYREARAGRTDYLALFQTLSVALPADAWLATVEERPPDTFVLSGYATRASDVLAALAGVPALVDVRAERPSAPTRLQGRPVESFTLAVELADGSP